MALLCLMSTKMQLCLTLFKEAGHMLLGTTYIETIYMY